MADTDTNRQFTAQLTRSFARVGVDVSPHASIPLPPAHKFVVTTDTLIAGRHFPLETGAADTGYKALAVNLSDLAAMGATPVATSLVLTLPALQSGWLDRFAAGWAELAVRHQVVMSDLQCGPGGLALHVHAYGALPASQPGLLRSQARVGDRVFVTGTLGDAACALQCLGTHGQVEPFLLSRLNRPAPRLAAGQALLGVANAAIDISDGLAADLNHLCARSGVGARIQLQQLPFSPALSAVQAVDKCWEYACGGGDDYELCFTLPAHKVELLRAKRQAMQVPVSMIGEIVEPAGLCDTNVVFYTPDDKVWIPPRSGYEHFVDDETEA